jgi:hypothetical protein
METDIPDREPDLRALERRLAGWKPSAGALDRDRMLYDAGRAAAGIHRWRLAAAALLLVSLGLGGLAMRQRVLIDRDRVLLAHERAQRLELETALAAWTAAPRPSAADTPPVGPPAPGSYLALTARLAADGIDAPWPAAESEPAPRPPAVGPTADEWRPVPLRTQDIQRILDL